MRLVDLMRWSPCAGAVALGLTAMIAAREGLAGTAQMATRLDYGAAPGCPAAPEFEAVVAGRLGYDPFRKGAPERVIVRIEPAGKSLEGHLEWRDATGGWIGEQTFPSRTGNCAEIARAMGFALALQFQMMVVLGAESHTASAPPSRPSPPSPAPSPTAKVASAAVAPSAPAGTSTTALPAASPTPATAPPDPTPTASPPRSPAVAVASDQPPAVRSPWSRPSFAVGAGGAVAFSSANSLAAGRLFGTVAWSHHAFELAGEVSVPSETRRADGAGFSQQEVLAEIAGCGVFMPWNACVLAKVGQLRVAGEQVDAPATPRALMVQTGLRLGYVHALGKRFELGGHVDGITRITQATVTLDSFPVGTTPRLALALGLDAAIIFP